MSGVRRVLWIDATHGASGDMVLGALVDLGLPLDELRAALASLPLEGWSIDSRAVVRGGLAATRVEVAIGAAGEGRRWADVERLLSGGGLERPVRERALGIFRRLFEAEARVHGRSPEQVHLHEAAATDAIVDVVGASFGIERLTLDEIVVSAMTTGFGEVQCAHGRLPVPAPATAWLVRGCPVRAGAAEGERLTPTGAAVLTSLADRWGGLPAMRPRELGHGAGGREFEGVPNVLRMILGEADAAAPGAGGEVAVLECTLDDATPQAVAFAVGRLLAAGALDAYSAPVTMKKGRPGHQLTVIGRPPDLERLARLVLAETSTLGLRYRLEARFELERELQPVETEFGTVRMKLGLGDGKLLHAWPEHDDCAALADARGVSLWRVQQAALAAWAAGPGREHEDRTRRQP